MANPKRGEVTFKADGEEYVLRYTTNALCSLEDAAGIKATALPVLLQEPSLGLLRNLLKFGLMENTPSMNDKRAGEIMDAIGIQTAVLHIGKALELAFPTNDGEPSENPPTAVKG